MHNKGYVILSYLQFAYFVFNCIQMFILIELFIKYNSKKLYWAESIYFFFIYK